jgi:hypothetical protein
MKDTPVCSIDTLFPYFMIFSFLLKLPISSSVSQTIKEKITVLILEEESDRDIACYTY